MTTQVETLEELQRRLTDVESRVARLEKAGHPIEKSPGAPKKMSVREFLNDRQPRDDVQRAVCIGYYHERIESAGAFNVEDLEKGFRRAKEPVPSNLNDKMYKAGKRGYVMEGEAKKAGLKAWVLTNTGEAAVEQRFSSAL